MTAGAAANRAAWAPAPARGLDAVSLSRPDKPGRGRQRFWAVEQSADTIEPATERAAVVHSGRDEPNEDPLYGWNPARPVYPPKQPGVIEIVLWNGVCVRVDNAVDGVVLRRVLDALQSR